MCNSFTPSFLILQYSVILLVILQFSVIRNVTEFCNITLSCNITVFSNLLDCGGMRESDKCPLKCRLLRLAKLRMLQIFDIVCVCVSIHRQFLCVCPVVKQVLVLRLSHIFLVTSLYYLTPR